MVPETHPVCRCDGSIARGAFMAQSIVSREELLENAYQIAERNGVSALSVRGLANATGVSVGTVYRHFSAKDELTTATIQLYFKHAFYERLPHRPAGRVRGLLPRDAREHARGHRALPRMLAARHRCASAVEGRRAPARVPANRAHSPRPRTDLRARCPNLGRFARRVRCESVCRFVIENVMGSLHHQNGNCKVLFGLLERTLYANNAQ